MYTRTNGSLLLCHIHDVNNCQAMSVLPNVTHPGTDPVEPEILCKLSAAAAAPPAEAASANSAKREKNASIKREQHNAFQTNRNRKHKQSLGHMHRHAKTYIRLIFLKMPSDGDYPWSRACWEKVVLFGKK